MDLADVHATAAAILRAAGYDEWDAPGAPALAKRLVGLDRVVRDGGRAAAVSLHGLPLIQLPRRGTPAERNFAIAHELAEWWLRRDGYEGERIEEVADAVAAALVAPRLAFAAAVREHGHDYPALAELFCATESLVALRVGEVIGNPIALVAPLRVRARGEPYEWPPEPELRRVANANPLPSGIVRARLRDDARRVVLRVA